ncbi:hypothetical protein ACMDCR_25825 [Labrys okinawensis]|uniref:hypothetical protein n=1 Tax=Labrys okinawensis TaxID=346911 RepID=UPI0039BD14F8
MAKIIGLVANDDRNTLSEPRRRLAEAIERASGQRGTLELRRAAVERAERMVSDAESALGSAKAAVETARKGLASETLAAVIEGRQKGSGEVLRRARLAEAEAEDALEAAQAALNTVRGQHEESEAEASRAREEIGNAAGAVMAPLAADLIQKAEEARLHWLRIRAACTVVRDAGFPTWPPTVESKALQRAAEAVLGEEEHSRGSKAFDEMRAAWNAAFRALLIDANAPLPEI